MLGSLKLNSITKSNVASLDIISITQTSSLLEVYVSKMILTLKGRSCVRLLASSSYSLGKQLGKPYITCEPIWFGLLTHIKWRAIHTTDALKSLLQPSQLHQNPSKCKKSRTKNIENSIGF